MVTRWLVAFGLVLLASAAGAWMFASTLAAQPPAPPGYAVPNPLTTDMTARGEPSNVPLIIRDAQGRVITETTTLYFMQHQKEIEQRYGLNFGTNPGAAKVAPSPTTRPGATATPPPPIPAPGR